MKLILKTPLQRGGAGLVSLVLAYIVGSKALDNGSLWFYLGTFVLLGFSVHAIRQVFKK